MSRYSFCFALLFSALGTVGCVGNPDNERVLDEAQGLNCGASSYTAFDPANHANQDLRVAAQAEIGARIADAEADPSLAAEVFADVEAIYQDTADLQAKVQGRGDDHFPGDPGAATVGQAMDADIVSAIARGKAAQSATEVAVAKHIIDKSLTRFFYLSVHHELLLGQRSKYDEAYGYLGTGPTGDPAELTSLAKIAHKRDANNGTAFAAQLFGAILDGSCALDKRLQADGAEAIEWTGDADYAAVVERLDALMLKVLAASVGHEFFAPIANLDADSAIIHLYEGAYYFNAIFDMMVALGGQAATDAAAIRAALDAAVANLEAGTPGWQDELDSDFIRDAVAAAFEVEIKG